MYGVFSPRGELVAAFRDWKAADAYTRYDWKALCEAAYWSIAPQPPTISRISLPEPEPPANPHLITEEPPTRCSVFHCERHTPRDFYSEAEA